MQRKALTQAQEARLLRRARALADDLKCAGRAARRKDLALLGIVITDGCDNFDRHAIVERRAFELSSHFAEREPNEARGRDALYRKRLGNLVDLDFERRRRALK